MHFTINSWNCSDDIVEVEMELAKYVFTIQLLIVKEWEL